MADGLAGKKKQEMAETAEQLLAGTGWLPPSLRTKPPVAADEAEADPDAFADMPEAPDMTELEAEDFVDPEAMPPETADPDETAPDTPDPDAQEIADPEEPPVSPDPDAEDGSEGADRGAFHEAAE